MSKKSEKSGKGAKSIVCYVPEPLRPVTPVPSGTDPNLLPYREWSDQEVNAEKWDLPKAAKEKEKPAKGDAPAKVEPPPQFIDFHVVHLPPSLPVYEWKRPVEVFPTATFVMYKDVSEYPDLVKESKHILHSDFMRSFISAVGILEYLGNTQTFAIEFATPKFTPNTNGIPWRPWHHIYSMCKAGKGQKHNPQVNTLGKYALRLFWMGCWRRVDVDDLLPVEISNHVQLPLLSTFGAPNDPSTQVIEMWPFLLCKAILKLSSLSYSKRNELQDFDIIHCLTGWFVQTLEVEGMQVEDIWDMCAGYSDHFTWPEPGADKASKKGSTKGSEKGPKFLDDNQATLPFHLVASCTDMRTIEDGKVPDISPCWSHSFLIDQTRNIPLIKPEPLPELARWKRFRWLAWAVAEGTWPAPLLIPIKCFKIVSPLKKCSEHVIYEAPSKEAMDIKNSVAVIEEIASKMKQKSDSKKSDKDSKKSDKSSKGGAKDVALPPDPSIWGDFNKLGPYMSSLRIFFKPSQFNCNIKITDVVQAASAKKPEKPKKGAVSSEPQIIMWNNELLESRNEPIYLFADSIDFKLITISLSQVGNVNNLHKHFNFEIDNLRKSYEKLVVKEPARRCHHRDLVSEVEVFVDETSTSSYTEAEEPACSEATAHESSPFAYITLESYNWQTCEVGEAVTVFNTSGTKTTLVDIKPGRLVSRLWVKSDTSFSIQILCDTPILVGTLEVVVESMRKEPEMLLQMCNDVSSTYGQLVQQFGTPNYKQGLVGFFNSYLPYAQLSPSQRSLIHRSFLYEFLVSIKENCPEVEFRERVFALKVLFVDPFISLPVEKVGGVRSESSSCSMSETSEEVEFAKKCERAAVTIQAFFKKLYVRKLKLLHDQSQPRYMKIFESLKKIYTELFAVNKRMFVCSVLLKKLLLANPDMDVLRNSYPLFFDLNDTVHLQYFIGEILITQSTWVPIARCVFYTNCPFPILIKICLFCNFSQYMVRVFNNDDGKEIVRHTNNTIVHSYESTSSGYTVLCYGWSEIECTKQWKLEFITLKQSKESLLIIPPSDIYNHVLKENYLPNVHNTICKCLLNINHDVSITVRLSTCYENVKFRIRCLNETGETFGEGIGIKNVTLPLLQLKYVPLTEHPSGTLSPKSSLSFTIDYRRPQSASVENALVRRRSSLKKRSTSNSLKRSSNASKRTESSFLSSESAFQKDTVYVIEAFVLDDTWPLLIDEWNLVEEIKRSKLVGPSLPHSELSEEEVEMSAPKLNPSMSVETNTERGPLWTLSTISHEDDSVMPIVDKRREEEIKQIKLKWYEEDHTRYERSKQLREEYLQSHYLQMQSVLESYDSNLEEGSIFPEPSRSCEKGPEYLSVMNEPFKNIRTHKKPPSETRMLPSFNFASYQLLKSGHHITPSQILLAYEEEVEEDEKDQVVKTAEDEEKEIVARGEAIADFEDYFKRFEGDMEKYLYDQLESIKILQIFYNDCREESAEIMKDSSKLREKIINAIIQAEMDKVPPPPLPKGKSDKKGKK